MALRIIQLINHGPMAMPAKSVFGHANAGLSPRQCTQLLFSPRNQINRFHRKNVSLAGPPVAESGASGAGSVLKKPILFTLGFSGSVFVGATIWEYENVRSQTIQVMRRPLISLRESFGRQSDSLTLKQIWSKATPGQRFFVPICALNLAVFGLWRLPSLNPIMTKLFMSNPAGRVLCWPMLLSTFSHMSAFHIFANMYVLYSFSNIFCMSMGTEQAAAVYLSAGVFASLASYVGKVVMGTGGASLGASGAIMAMLGYVCCRFPDSQLSIIFLPMFTFSAGNAIAAIMSLDAAGVILGWKFFDHAAHLGGALFGIFWFYVGQKELWPARRVISEKWHKLRTNE